jgi:hypothetical protein
MWPVILGAGIVVLANKLLNNKEPSKRKLGKRVFISFSMKDEEYRDHLVSQSKENKSPFYFVDMSVKKPWDKEVWKKKCRSKIKSCDGVIVMLSKNTWHSSGTRWEIKCAQEENVPIVAMHIQKKNRGAIPKELEDGKIISWTWPNLAKAIKEF